MDWGVSHNHREGALETQPVRRQRLLCVLNEEGNREDLSPSCYSWGGTSRAGRFPTLPPSVLCCGAVVWEWRTRCCSCLSYTINSLG